MYTQLPSTEIVNLNKLITNDEKHMNMYPHIRLSIFIYWICFTTCFSYQNVFEYYNQSLQTFSHDYEGDYIGYSNVVRHVYLGVVLNIQFFKSYVEEYECLLYMPDRFYVQSINSQYFDDTIIGIVLHNKLTFILGHLKKSQKFTLLGHLKNESRYASMKLSQKPDKYVLCNDTNVSYYLSSKKRVDFNIPCTIYNDSIPMYHIRYVVFVSAIVSFAFVIGMCRLCKM